ncbi:Eco57I restriction-modification methylase domain-containing protein [Cupriavidus sp. H18C1]|uniref:Eco57I restriction-modification methylase domain-containing protein n=1 Tax=Cupriavidus sp. H18C1 TaxID=3241601 RepID=UPI003BB88374
MDIDPRAAQIASLALWLRAQRAWHDAGVKAKDRPLIGRGHVVAAIAPPAERELRQQFAASLDQRDAELFEKTLQLLKGLPEMGVLLQVERMLPNLIRQIYVGKGTGLFAAQEQESWQHAETRLSTALNDFARAAKATYQGRLFAQDALQGLRLIDLCREVFDVVVMNPPFGALASGTKDQLAKAYPRSKNDLLAIMVERGLELLRAGGRIGAITSRTCFFLSSFQKWRDEVVLGVGHPEVMADLGLGVMDDALVEAAAYVLEKQV